nr:hypothetical protein [Tanacetum cinerariifolium]
MLEARKGLCGTGEDGPIGGSYGGKGGSCGSNDGRGGSMVGRGGGRDDFGVSKSLLDEILRVVTGESGRDDFGVSKSLLDEILRVVTGESGGETFGVDGGAIWHIILDEFCRKMLSLKFKNRFYCFCTMLPVLPVPFAEWNRLCFSMEPATADVAEKHFLVCAYMKQCGGAVISTQKKIYMR